MKTSTVNNDKTVRYVLVAIVLALLANALSAQHHRVAVTTPGGEFTGTLYGNVADGIVAFDFIAAPMPIGYIDIHMAPLGVEIGGCYTWTSDPGPAGGPVSVVQGWVETDMPTLVESLEKHAQELSAAHPGPGYGVPVPTAGCDTGKGNPFAGPLAPLPAPPPWAGTSFIGGGVVVGQ